MQHIFRIYNDLDKQLWNFQSRSDRGLAIFTFQLCFFLVFPTQFHEQNLKIATTRRNCYKSREDNKMTYLDILCSAKQLWQDDGSKTHSNAFLDVGPLKQISHIMNSKLPYPCSCESDLDFDHQQQDFCTNQPKLQIQVKFWAFQKCVKFQEKAVYLLMNSNNVRSYSTANWQIFPKEHEFVPKDLEVTFLTDFFSWHCCVKDTKKQTSHRLNISSCGALEISLSSHLFTTTANMHHQQNKMSKCFQVFTAPSTTLT